MNPQVFIALSIALTGFSSGWLINGWRYASKEAERAKQELVDIQQSAAANIRRADNVIQAQNLASKRLVKLQIDNSAAHTELDRLRSQLTSMPRPSVSAEACTERADTTTDILLECAARYTEMAATADRWQNNAVTLDEAWPKK